MMTRFAKITALTLAVSSMAACTHNNGGLSYGHPSWNGGMEPTPADTTVDASAKILPQTHVAAARLHEKQGAFDEAIRQYRRAIAVSHRYAEAYHGLGTLLSRMGRGKEALSSLQKAAAMAPKDPIVRNNLGYALLVQGRWTEAVDEFERATILKPSFARAHINLGLTLGKLQRFEEALDSLLAVLPPADAHYNIGLLHIAQSRFDEAKLEFETSLSIDPQFVAAETRLDEINAVNGDTEQNERLAHSGDLSVVEDSLTTATDSESPTTTTMASAESHVLTAEREIAIDPVRRDDRYSEGQDWQWIENDVDKVTDSAPVVASVADESPLDYNDSPCEEDNLDLIDFWAIDNDQEGYVDSATPVVSQRTEPDAIGPNAADDSKVAKAVEADPIDHSSNSPIADAEQVGDTEWEEPCVDEMEWAELPVGSYVEDEKVLIDPSLPLVAQGRVDDPDEDVDHDESLSADSLSGRYVMLPPDDLGPSARGQDEHGPYFGSDAAYSLEELASIVYEESGIDPSVALVGQGSGVDGPSDPALERLGAIDWESALAELEKLLPPIETNDPCSDYEDGIPPETVALPEPDAASGADSQDSDSIVLARELHSVSQDLQTRYLVATRKAPASERAGAIPPTNAHATHLARSSSHVDPARRLKRIRNEIDCWESVLLDVQADNHLDVDFTDAGARVWDETADEYAPDTDSVAQTTRVSRQDPPQSTTDDSPRTTMSMSVDSKSDQPSGAESSDPDEPSTNNLLGKTREENPESPSSRTPPTYDEHSERKSTDRNRRLEADSSPTPEISVYDLMKFFSISSNEMRCWNAGKIQEFLRKPTAKSPDTNPTSASRPSDSGYSRDGQVNRGRGNRGVRDETMPRRYRIGRQSYDHTVKPVRD